MIHFCPVNGCYVYARQYEGKVVLVILNGTDKEQTLPLKHYAEIIGSKSNAMDLTSEKNFDLQSDLKLSPRESLILPL